MQNLKLIITIILTKILITILKFTGKGSGTALPGLLIEKYSPSTFQQLITQIPNIIVITGTNGKTTTQTILKSIFDETKKNVITNISGSNMSRGILSELINQTNFFGKLNFEFGIFEVEEATLPRIIDKLNPKIIAVTNLYRDQLDAYGEIDITRKYIRKAIEKSSNAKVILNADDPMVSTLTENLNNETYYFSLPEEYRKNIPYEGQFIINNNQDPNTYKANNLKTKSDLSTNFTVENADIQLPIINLASPGSYHVYNALCAIIIADILKFKPKAIENGVNNFKPAFGRGEIITTKKNKNQIKYRLMLIKNPAGFSLNLKLLENAENLKLVILINDNIADGKDVSWLWDSEIENINKLKIKKLYLGGTRAKDMSVRLKYAMKSIPKDLIIEEDFQKIINKTKEETEDNETIFVLPTYTAMLKFRKLLGLSLDDIT